MNISDRTFVFCPTYEINGVEQVHVKTLESIRDMRGNWEFLLGRFNPYSVKHLNILNQYRTARQIFLQGDCGHFMTIEHDMIIPPNALELMLATDADVIYGLYLFRHGSHSVNAYTLPNGRNPGTSLSNYPELFRRARNEITPVVGGAGFGCMLVRRHVLDDLDFHGKLGADSCIPDVEFALDCYERGYVQRCNFLVECGHIEPGGNVLYPLRGDENMKNVKMLQSIIADVNGVSMPLQAGQECELPPNVVEELVRAGYAVRIEEKKRSAPRRRTTKSVEPKKKGE